MQASLFIDFFRMKKSRWMSQMKALGYCGLSLLLVAFRSVDDEITRYIHQVKMRPNLSIEAQPQFDTLKHYQVSEQGEHQSPFDETSVKKLMNLQVENFQNPTAQIPLGELHFVGILKRDDLMWGLIHQPGGLVTHVSIGDYLGQNDFQVIAIQQKLIQLQQKLRVGRNWVIKIIELPMRPLSEPLS